MRMRDILTAITVVFFLVCFWFLAMSLKMDIKDISTISIAFCALIATIWNSLSLRKHQELSVQPDLTLVEFNRYEPPQIKFTLKNSGLGPGIIKRIRVFLDGKEKILSENYGWNNLVNEMQLPFQNLSGTGVTLGGTVSMRVGDEICIFSVNHQNSTTIDSLLLHEQMKRVGIRVEYESIYGKKMTIQGGGLPDIINNKNEHKYHRSFIIKIIIAAIILFLVIFGWIYAWQHSAHVDKNKQIQTPKQHIEPSSNMPSVIKH